MEYEGDMGYEGVWAMREMGYEGHNCSACSFFSFYRKGPSWRVGRIALL